MRSNGISRRTLYIILSVIVILTLTVTIAYAALSVTLNIVGTADVIAPDWTIYLENPIVKSGSVSNTAPTITGGTTASFTATLAKPGDYYGFTIDVKNDGGFDAMIDSIVKEPTLTEAQAKYLTYTIEYETTKDIAKKQTVRAGGFVRLKVLIKFRDDANNYDLPEVNETLQLSFTLTYIRTDDSTDLVDIPYNGIEQFVTVVSGTGTQKGDLISITDQEFYVVKTIEDSVVLLAKHNLQVGKDCTSTCSNIPNPTGLQDENSLGHIDTYPYKSVVSFSTTDYWSSTIKTDNLNVYDSQSKIYQYVESYKTYIEELGVQVEEARLITYDELIELDCTPPSSKTTSNMNCQSAPAWVKTSSYWTGTATILGYSDGTSTKDRIWAVKYDSNSVLKVTYNLANGYGVRPVIVIPISEIPTES